MKVSVIVPVYNVEKYLEKCLDSLANQTLDKFEVIIVNDGSTDNSEEIIKNYVKKYPKKFKSFTKENGGLSDARNFGLKYAKGEYIAFVDSDDYIKKDMLLKMYSYAKSKELDVVVCDTIIKEDKKEYILKSNLKYAENDIKNYIISYPMACTRLIKRDIIKNFEFKKGILYEDLNSTPLFVLKTNKIGFVDYAGYYYVQRTGSIMKQTKFNKKLLYIFEVLKNVKDNLYDKYPDEVEYLYITHLLRSTTLRFLDYYGASTYLYKIVQTMKKEFPNWKKNIYLQKSGFKLKLICKLAYNRNYTLLKIIKKLTNK